MGYRNIIKQIQHDAGFSDAESEEALGRLVEGIAERLEVGERMKFARQLPPELQDVVYAVTVPSKKERHRGIIEEVMEKEDISHDHAKKQVLTSWHALKQFMSRGLVRNVKSQLPNSVAQTLA